MSKTTKRIILLGDTHCGHAAGLTPPDYQWPVHSEDEHRAKLANAQREFWGWYTKQVKAVCDERKPYAVFFNGDAIDGRGEKSGGTELVTTDRNAQINMATQAIRQWKCDRHVFTYGCLTPGHRVLTADLRWVPVETLEVGDSIVGFDEEPATPGAKRRWKLATVKANKPVRRQVYDIHLSDGSKLTATGDHPFLVRASQPYRWLTVNEMRQWFYNQDGKPSNVCPLQFRRIMPVWGDSLSREAGYIAGFMDGEGHCSFGKRKRKSRGGSDEYVFRVAAAQRKNRALEYAQHCMEVLGWPYSVTQAAGRDVYTLTVMGATSDKMHFLGPIRPNRLIDRLSWDSMGVIKSGFKDETAITGITDAGVQEVSGLSTSTGTYVSEGFLSHNTAYHTGAGEDYEDALADNFDAPIGAHEWPVVNGLTFDLRHHVGSSSIPHGRYTQLAKQHLWNRLWAKDDAQPESNIIVRSHVHYHGHVGSIEQGKPWLAMTLPALQLAATKFGGRRCDGVVHVGFVVVDVTPNGGYSWHPRIATLQHNKARTYQV